MNPDPSNTAAESRPRPASNEPPAHLVTVVREGSGESIVFIARTRNAAEVAELDDCFGELKAGCHVRILSRGPVMAAAVKVMDDVDGEATIELMSLLESLGARYSFSKVDLGLHPTLNRLIEDMALDTGSALSPSPHCSLCGRPEPFPTRLTLEAPNEMPAEGLYCSRCIAGFSDRNERDLVGDLLRSDRATFTQSDGIELSPSPMRRGNRVSYQVQRRVPLAATG